MSEKEDLERMAARQAERRAEAEHRMVVSEDYAIAVIEFALGHAADRSAIIDAREKLIALMVGDDAE